MRQPPLPGNGDLCPSLRDRFYETTSTRFFGFNALAHEDFPNDYAALGLEDFESCLRVGRFLRRQGGGWGMIMNTQTGNVDPSSSYKYWISPTPDCEFKPALRAALWHRSAAWEISRLMPQAPVAG